MQRGHGLGGGLVWRRLGQVSRHAGNHVGQRGCVVGIGQCELGGVVAPEQFVAHLQRRHAEHAKPQRLLAIRQQFALDLVAGDGRGGIIDRNYFSALPGLEALAMARLDWQHDDGTTRLAIGRRDSYASYTPILVEREQRINRQLSVTATVGRDQPATENAALRVAGLRQQAGLGLTLRLSGRDQLNLRFDDYRYSAQNGLPIGRARQTQLEYAHAFRSELSDLIGSAFAFDFVKSGQIGAVRKIVVRDGHGGPVESGCQPRFLDWLLDPAESGGGALVDFGCYGVNLVSALLEGRRPRNVTAAVRRFKPDIYQKVEDDATILLDYGDFDVVIQPSWCWPFPRKDMEIHGDAGYILAPDANTVRFRRAGEERETVSTLPALPPGHHEPFAFLAGLVRGERNPAPYDLSGLDNNLIVSAVLDLAKRSSRGAQKFGDDV